MIFRSDLTKQFQMFVCESCFIEIYRMKFEFDTKKTRPDFSLHKMLWNKISLRITV